MPAAASTHDGDEPRPASQPQLNADFGAATYPRGMHRRLLTSLLVALAVTAACGTGAPSFDPRGPCTTDGQVPGAYPDLEALIPATFDGRPPDRLDSGRSCTEARLGTLSRDGHDEVRFAGGLWEAGTRSGLTMAVFRAPGLTGQQLFDFYEAGARAGRRTEDITTSVDSLNGAPAWRLTTLNDESYQTIVVWQSDEPDVVRAVLVGSDVRETSNRAEHNELVTRAENAFLVG